MITRRNKNEMTKYWIVTAYSYRTGEHYAIICSDALQASMVFSRVCAAGNMFGEPKQCSLSDSQEMTRLTVDEKRLDGIHLTTRSTFLMGNYSHDITDEEINAMEQLVAAAFPKRTDEQEKTDRFSARTAISTKLKDNRIDKIEKIRL